MKLTVIQTLPALNAGGVERGTIDVANELVRQGHRSIVVSAGGQLVDALRAAGSEHIVLPVGKKAVSTLLLIKKLRDIITQSKADIIHARSRLPAWISYLAWRLTDRRMRPGFITTVHGPYTVNRYSRIMTRGERVIAISAFIQKYINENYADVDMDKVLLIPRGISPDSFPYGYKPPPHWRRNWEQQYPQLCKQYVITLPARITRWKGQQDFLRIIARLRMADIPVHGVIAGGAEPRRLPYLHELKALARKAGVEDHITFTGHRNDLKEVMSVSSLVMSLAREPEAFGRTALEALGLGVPVVAYDHGGASEVLQQIFPRGLVSALNIDAAVRRVQEFYPDPPLVPACLPFTLELMLQRTLRLYQSLAAEKS